MQKTLKLSEYIEEIYKNYSLYVLSSRAITDWTGLKRSHIKILWTANKYCRKFMKTLAFSGACILYSNFHHSPDSLAGTISRMCQDFCGRNNYPLLKGQGNFGNQLNLSWSAERYTEVKLSENFDYFFPKEDMSIVPYSNDPEQLEPICMLPILPINLINGSNGIAVGFAETFYSRNLSALCKAVENILKNKKVDSESLMPWFRDYRGKIYKDSKNNVMMEGKFTRLPKNIILIEEVPLFNHDLVTYKELLYNLKDEGKIVSFVDESDGKWKISVKVPEEIYKLSDDEILKMFDLKDKLNENLTIIGMDGNVKVFQNVEDYLRYFVDCRKGFYDLRKEYLLNENAKDILKCKIKRLIMDSLKSGMTKAELVENVMKCFDVIKLYFQGTYKLSENEYSESVMNIVSNIKLTESLSDKRDEYDSEIQRLENERERLSNYDTTDMYLDDLKKLRKLEN